MKNHNEKQLEAKVAARNKVNTAVLLHTPAIIEALKPLVGKKIFKAAGGITHAAMEVLPKEISGDVAHNPLSIWYESTRYGIRVFFRICELVPDSHCQYADESFMVGNGRGAILESVCALPTPKQWRIDYTAEEIRQARIDLIEAADAAAKIESKLFHFGKYDQ